MNIQRKEVVYNYRGHQAKLCKDGRRVTLNSQFLVARSEEVTQQDEKDVIYNMYRRWFEEEVDSYIKQSEETGTKVVA